MLMPMPSAGLSAWFSGLYGVDRRVSDTDYVIRTPERRRRKPVCATFTCLQPSDAAVVGVFSLVEVQPEWKTDLVTPCGGHQSGRLRNSNFLSTVNDQLSYMSAPQKQDVINLLHTYPLVLGVPTRTTVLEHEIDVGSATPIKQHASHCPPAKREAMQVRWDTQILYRLSKSECNHSDRFFSSSQDERPDRQGWSRHIHL